MNEQNVGPGYRDVKQTKLPYAFGESTNGRRQFLTRDAHRTTLQEQEGEAYMTPMV